MTSTVLTKHHLRNIIIKKVNSFFLYRYPNAFCYDLFSFICISVVTDLLHLDESSIVESNAIVDFVVFNTVFRDIIQKCNSSYPKPLVKQGKHDI